MAELLVEGACAGTAVEGVLSSSKLPNSIHGKQQEGPPRHTVVRLRCDVTAMPILRVFPAPGLYSELARCFHQNDMPNSQLTCGSVSECPPCPNATVRWLQCYIARAVLTCIRGAPCRLLLQ